MYVVEVLLLVCTYIVCIVHMYVLLISGKTAQLKSLLANFFRLREDQRLVHIVRQFLSMDIMMKVQYFLVIQIHDLRTFEVEHCLNMIWRLSKDLS